MLFPSQPLDKTKDEMKKLVQKLKRSMILGNIDRTKMRIIFEDNEGKKEVRTTVWAVGFQDGEARPYFGYYDTGSWCSEEDH